MLDMRSKPSEKQTQTHKKVQLSNSTEEAILTIIVIRTDKSRVNWVYPATWWQHSHGQKRDYLQNNLRFQTKGPMFGTASRETLLNLKANCKYFDLWIIRKNSSNSFWSLRRTKLTASYLCEPGKHVLRMIIYSGKVNYSSKILKSRKLKLLLFMSWQAKLYTFGYLLILYD